MSGTAGFRRLAGVGLLLLLPLAVLGWWFSKKPAGPRDPRLAGTSPYRNVRPEVRYVGDASCRKCHADYSESYHGHPMGRSLAPVAEAEPIERYDAEARNPFTVGPFRYSARREGEKMFHTEARLDAAGEVVVERTEEVHYSVGSGQRGRSYLISDQGGLRMSPLTWYPEKGIWDLSPGYERSNQHFNREILAACLFCHTNHALDVPETLNQYRPPIFEGYPIGCERCHGPGELHVAKYERTVLATKEFDDTIVNPEKLEPKLREAVCQQCHLGGVVRVLTRGRDTYDYRPGLPLEDFLAVFVAEKKADSHKFVGHVEQMHVSRCFTQSAGKLGCTSCHDPHRQPKPAEKIAFYNGRCANCHDAKSPCTAPLADRQARQDNCTACHMPPLGTQINHTAVSDHRVLRRPEPLAPAAPASPGQLTPFGTNASEADRAAPDFARNLGIALVMAGDREQIDPTQAAGAVKMLEQAVARDPEDTPAQEAYALALSSQGRHAESLRVFESLLARVPKREFSLANAASEARHLGKLDLAVDYWRRAAELNPTQVRYPIAMARAYLDARRWEECAAAARAALALQPSSPQSRQYLVRALLGLCQLPEADAEFAILMRLDPPDPEGLKRWFAEERGR